jgi:hypothetical protein
VPETEREQNEDPAITARKLIDMLAETSAPRSFKRGDLVMQLPYSPYSLPPKGKPAIVVEVLQTPILDPQPNAESFDFRLPLDMIIGVVCNGAFLLFHQCSRYLQPYNGDVA